jgi:hypothetical protein
MAELASESCKKRTCLLRPHSHYIDQIQCTVLRSPSILIFKQQEIQALPLYRAGDLGGTQTPGLLLFYFNLILSNLWTTLHIEPLTNTINTILWCVWVKSHTRPQKFWWCKILHCGHILAHKSRLQIVGFFYWKFCLTSHKAHRSCGLKGAKICNLAISWHIDQLF